MAAVCFVVILFLDPDLSIIVIAYYYKYKQTAVYTNVNGYS